MDAPIKNGLTTREKEICSHVIEGLSNDEIAKKLFISPNTVKAHLKAVFKKKKVKSRTQLIAFMKIEK